MNSSILDPKTLALVRVNRFISDHAHKYVTYDQLDKLNAFALIALDEAITALCSELAQDGRKVE